jgi:UDP-glucose 4-epimerase
VGAGGLLGGQVAAALARAGNPAITPRVRWAEPHNAASDLREGLADLMRRARGGPFAIAWCAGAAVTASTAAKLDEEREVFRGFLDALAGHPSRASATVFLASSAGGAYGGSPDRPPFTEHSATGSLSAYGDTKLAMEQAARDCAEASGATVLCGRIANLYGPGQNLAKRQGLISQICLAEVTGRPLVVSAPLETRRDYLFAPDCAEMVVEGLCQVRERVDASTPTVTKILASGRSVSIAAVLDVAQGVFGRRVPLADAVPEEAGQAPDMTLRSVVWPELDRHVRTSLEQGITATVRDVARRAGPGEGRAS